MPAEITTPILIVIGVILLFAVLIAVFEHFDRKQSDALDRLEAEALIKEVRRVRAGSTEINYVKRGES